MRLRVHDDGRWAIDNGVGGWMLLREGVYEPHAAAELHEPGWREAVVLIPSDADARRLADAWYGHDINNGRWDDSGYARAVLDRLAGTEGER